MRPWTGVINRIACNPDIRLALVLGMNETLFPAPPQTSVLLTDADRNELEKQQVFLGSSTRQQLGHERYFGYVACTRARQRLVLTSSCLRRGRQAAQSLAVSFTGEAAFSRVEFEVFPKTLDWRKSEHANELIAPLLQNQVKVEGSKAGGKVRHY